MVLIDLLTWFAFGGIGILIVVIAMDVFHGGDAATGYLNVALGVGGTVGALLSAALVLRPRLGQVLLVGAAASSAPRRWSSASPASSRSPSWPSP